MSETLYYRFVVKRDTAANFAAKNTLLLEGEFGLETDTGKLKMGDGVTPWNSLGYHFITQTIADGDTTHAPSGDAVFDALALKATLAANNLFAGINQFSAQPEITNTFALIAMDPGDTGRQAYFGGWDNTARMVVYDSAGGALFKQLTAHYTFGLRWENQVIWHAGNLIPLYNPTDLSTAITNYPNDQVSGGNIAGIARSHITVRTGADNRVMQFIGWPMGGTQVPRVEVRLSHTTSGGGGWTAPVELWHTGNFDPAAKFDKVGGDISGVTTFSGIGQFGQMRFTGTSGGGGEGFVYTDSGGGIRFGFFFPGSNIVAVGNRAASGVVHLRANTATAGSAGEVTAAIVNSAGLVSGVDNARTCGSASLRWSEVFAGNATINTSDAREKTAPRDLTDEELAAATDLARLPSIFQWLHAIEAKGDDARLHCSPTVQAVMRVMKKHGLDPLRYAFVCYDEWPERVEPAEYEAVEVKPAVTHDHPAIYERVQVYTEDGQPERFAERLVSPAWTEVVEPAVTEQRLVREAVTHPAGDRYSLRPSELAWFVIRGQEARLTALEG